MGEKKKFLGKIEIKLFKSENYLIIEIKDNGSGIQKDDLPKLFRPFFTTKGASRGSGVGLYFCKRTMEDRGGKIYVKETELGVGTTFRLEFQCHENGSGKIYE